jgi:RHS repeat-associated protein
MRYQLFNRIRDTASDSTPSAYYLYDGALPTATASAGSGSVTITGSEQHFVLDCVPPPTPCPTIYDSGTISISVGTATESVSYGQTSTAANRASALAQAFNGDPSSPVTATVNGATITFTAILKGANTNYGVGSNITWDEYDFPDHPSFNVSPASTALTGGSGTCVGTGITISPANPIGRRTGMCDQGGAEAWSYDVMGRTQTEQRTTNNVTKSTSYTYNPDGSLATLTYPSGRTITYGVNSASQLVSAVDSTNSINYATGATYAPQGALAALTLGNSGGFSGIAWTASYTSRLQPNELKATSSAGTALDFVYNFVDGSSNNNGNVMGITNSKDSTRSQTFAYDQLNRILSAQTSSTTGGNCWGEAFGYDAWGNLLSIGAQTGYSSCTQEHLSLGVNSSNRVTNSGYSYDASGNLLGDGMLSYSWDAESKIKTAQGVNYTYDGDGNRLQKSSGKIYWYGAGSEILDESDGSGNITDEYVFFGGKRIAHRVVSTGNIYYYMEDFLGSSRVVTDSSGNVCYEADFYPFGGERTITNSCPQNYKFEGKERDSETGNDDFGARYYSSSTGRWLSPDWSAIPAPVPYANLTNPQTLNLYAMVRDNPETFADLDGHYLNLESPMATTSTNLDQVSGYAPGSCGCSGYTDETGTATVDKDGNLLSVSFAPPDPASSAADPAPQQTAQNQSIAGVAGNKVGSPDYLVANAKGKYGPGSDKCNELVADTIEESGKPRPQVPYTGWKGILSALFGLSRDPDAHEWADPKVNIPGWSSPKPLSEARAGDVIAQGHGPRWGHSGIVVGPGTTVSVDTTTIGHPAGTVTRSNWGFRAAPGNGEGPGDRAPVVRHYIGVSP